MDDKMKLSVIGEIADKYWLEIPEHFPFVKLDAHVVMPNHVHGIVIIDKTDDKPKIGQNDERKQGLQNMQGTTISISSGNPVSTTILSERTQNINE